MRNSIACPDEIGMTIKEKLNTHETSHEKKFSHRRMIIGKFHSDFIGTGTDL